LETVIVGPLEVSIISRCEKTGEAVVIDPGPMRPDYSHIFRHGLKIIHAEHPWTF
jgi:hypothetical protein